MISTFIICFLRAHFKVGDEFQNKDEVFNSISNYSEGKFLFNMSISKARWKFKDRLTITCQRSGHPENKKSIVKQRPNTPSLTKKTWDKWKLLPRSSNSSTQRLLTIPPVTKCVRVIAVIKESFLIECFGVGGVPMQSFPGRYVISIDTVHTWCAGGAHL